MELASTKILRYTLSATGLRSQGANRASSRGSVCNALNAVQTPNGLWKIMSLTEEQIENLSKITQKFGKAHARVKEEEAAKGTAKTAFFKAIDEILAEGDLATKTVDVSGVAAKDLEAWVKENYPVWEFVSFEPDDQGEPFEALIKENPSLKPYAFVNHDDGQVYSRGIREGSPTVDDKALQEKDEDLYLDVTEPSREEQLLSEFMNHIFGSNWSEDEELAYGLDSFVESREFPRQLRPIEGLSQDELLGLRPFIVTGNPSQVMNAPRKAKPEELA